MKLNALIFAMPMLFAAGSAVAAETSEGYYASAKYLQSEQRAKEMDTSARPGVGQFVAGNEKAHNGAAALAAGYQWGNGWRTEGEYTFGQKSEFTSGSSTFTSSYNHLQTDVQRLMLNVYRDYQIGYNVALYGTAGVGVSKIKAGGWQGNSSRQYASTTQNNLTYSVGAGISYTPIEQVSLDLGYRYVDMGKIESGYNTFGNARGFKDEQMKAHLVENQFVLGARYLF
ncbi:outer membrane beta-barrel protein [Pantoea sp. EABMAA-21]|uniref:outer membrane protein n=1 Tax=Pantoea sp. EABMAA-21 TaxID=3043302 RepID=UPI0024B532F4|nr:outer membrane beta-barrel protein [Pantoea sp. EABMAA-21]MDI9277720.1 outer membrane beta-barrel protein [Pantoea sp. EABMAA-21]